MQQSSYITFCLALVLVLAGMMAPIVHADDGIEISVPLQETGPASGQVTFTFELDAHSQQGVFPNTSSAVHPTPIAAVPEPSTLVLVGLGLLGGVGLLRKRRKR